MIKNIRERVRELVSNNSNYKFIKRSLRLHTLIGILGINVIYLHESFINLDNMTDDDIDKIFKEGATISHNQFILLLLVLLDTYLLNIPDITKYLQNIMDLYIEHEKRMGVLELLLYAIVVDAITNLRQSVKICAVMGYEDPDWLAVKNRKGE